ncbi:hypothetical protein [Candidatus Avelusimicrobium sp.]
MAENKKDSFTFSDKIKNSKPAFNPFSKRISSKIGNNGKPKKTLFERTRRDAPFFVAALAALLMLPFLYKYSGSVDDGGIITPGVDDTIFSPDTDRTGFIGSSGADPDGQIVQLSGRDSLDLINGWGNEPEKTNDSLPDFDRDGYSSSSDSYSSSSRPNNDYSNYRKQRPQETRAGFARASSAPTKINPLGKSGMNFRGGGGVGSRFGGAQLKAAARQNSAPAPKQGIKPVSLQPLRAAGSPSRSYFGMGGAKQAQASREAMTKANAAEGLKEAMFNPVQSGRHIPGGIGTGDFVSGGGAGKWDPSNEFKGITPWWWDMMKKRDQMQWEWKFKLWRENLVLPLVKKLGEILAEFVGGMTCCLVTGEDDCSMGSMWGTTEGGGQKEGCKIAGADPVTYEEYCKDFPQKDDPHGLCAHNAKTFKETCKDMQAQGKRKWEWVATVGAGGDLSAWDKRMFCMGNTVQGQGISIKDRYDCDAINTTRNFQLQTTGRAKNWNHYHIVVAKNYVPLDDGGSTYLCKTSTRDVNNGSSSGLANYTAQGGKADVEKERQKMYMTNSTIDGTGNEYRADGLVREELNDACVIYIAEGKVFDWDNFQAKTEKLLKKYVEERYKGNDKVDINAMTKRAFNALHLVKIEGFAFKKDMSAGIFYDMPLDLLPYKYADFERDYIWSRQYSGELKGKYYDGKERRFERQGAFKRENALRTGCAFTNFRISANVIDALNDVKADLTFDPDTHGANAGNIQVFVEFKDNNGSTLVSRAKVNPTKAEGDAANEGLRTYAAVLTEDQVKTLEGAAKNGPVTALWTAKFGDKTSQDDESYVGKWDFAVKQVRKPKPQCTQGQELKGEIKIYGVMCSTTRKCTDKGTWGEQVLDDPTCGQPPAAAASVAEQQVPAPVVVNFFDTIDLVMDNAIKPLDSTWRLRPAQAQSNACTKLADFGNKKLLGVDTEISKLLVAAKEKYDAANTWNIDQNLSTIAETAVKELQKKGVTFGDKKVQTTLEYDEESVTVAELLDAMSIVQTDIPLNAVCMLGKTIGAYSVDPTAKNGNNMFGTFAAFMGYDASFFPGRKWVKDGREDLDPRFLGCVSGGKPGPAGKQYHYGHYNWNHKQLGDQDAQKDRVPFEAELNNGPWKGFPLAPIAKAVNFSRKDHVDGLAANESMDEINRVEYHTKYDDVFQSEGSCDLGDATMSYTQVKAYIQALCDHGTSIKPTNGDILQCGSRFKPSEYVVGQ